MKIKHILTALLVALSLSSCGRNSNHEHTFDEKWSYNDFSHWKEATCDHTNISKDFGEHVDSDKDGNCDICSHISLLDKFSFVFNSDYCSMNNQDIYSKNSNIVLTLSVQEEHKDYYVVPSDVNVLIGKTVGIKNVHYEYLVNKETNTATLSLTVSEDIVVTALYKDSENIYRVGPTQFAYAMDFSNFDYIQSHYVDTLMSPSYSRANETFFDLSPRVNFQYGCISRSGVSEYIYYEMMYYEHCGDYLNKYNFDSTNFSWFCLREDDLSYFFRPEDIVSRIFDRFDEITYDLIKDCFNENSQSYKFILSVLDLDYEMSISFNQNKITYVNCTLLQEESGTVETKETYITYNEYVPELPKI